MTAPITSERLASHHRVRMQAAHAQAQQAASRAAGGNGGGGGRSRHNRRLLTLSATTVFVLVGYNAIYRKNTASPSSSAIMTGGGSMNTNPGGIRASAPPIMPIGVPDEMNVHREDEELLFEQQQQQLGGGGLMVNTNFNEEEDDEDESTNNVLPAMPEGFIDADAAAGVTMGGGGGGDMLMEENTVSPQEEEDGGASAAPGEIEVGKVYVAGRDNRNENNVAYNLDYYRCGDKYEHGVGGAGMIIGGGRMRNEDSGDYEEEEEEGGGGTSSAAAASASAAAGIITSGSSTTTTEIRIVQEVVLLHGAKYTKEDWKTSGILQQLCTQENDDPASTVEGQPMRPHTALSVIALDISVKSDGMELASALESLISDGVLSGMPLVIVSPSASGKGIVNLAEISEGSCTVTMEDEGGDVVDSEEDENDDDPRSLLRRLIMGWIPVACGDVLGASEDALKEFTVAQIPILAVHGSNDGMGEKASNRLETWAGAKRIVLGEQHACYLDDPEGFVDVVKGFVESLLGREDRKRRRRRVLQ